jgi:phosphonopyruvate decarboxylase
MNIPFLVLSDQEEEVKAQIAECYSHLKKHKAPFVLIAKSNTFSPYTAQAEPIAPDTNNISIAQQAEMSREEAIEIIIRASSKDDVFISTTGMASRELYELREKYNMGHKQDFLTVGSMGHASSLALAIAIQKPELKVNCIDGDGAALMHMGSIAAIGERKPPNLRHIVLNNGAHDSVGGQPTIARNLNLSGIAHSAGYSKTYSVSTPEELERVLSGNYSAENDGPLFIEVLVRKGSRDDLGRPRLSPQENKELFMRFLAKGE